MMPKVPTSRPVTISNKRLRFSSMPDSRVTLILGTVLTDRAWGRSVVASSPRSSLHHSEGDDKRKIRQQCQAGSDSPDRNQRTRKEFADPVCASEFFHSDGSEKEQEKED